ncbi:DNA polymerase III subunit epsilon [Thiotrichales bacterium 19S9-12]|nr:DNA polymerase III subunit epsilon [Thiotrichales bacterium 19S9-11]MCF6811113.1 DNA polymerase III subunit epsilon [Thiotrichales bacterium 19S9-12]
MEVRQIFLDTETSGFEFKDGHRIIEFGAVEAIDRKLTGKTLHFYFKPDIEIESGAFEVHGISNERLENEPLFEEKVSEIMTFLTDAEIIIHNAGFDVPFINYELGRLSENHWGKLDEYCQITDSLYLARRKYPGQRNSLDALCKRFMIDNSERSLHGALLDAELLAKVYFAMTGGQTKLALNEDNKIKENQDENINKSYKNLNLKVLDISDEASQKHQKYLELLNKKSKQQNLWHQLENNQE